MKLHLIIEQRKLHNELSNILDDNLLKLNSIYSDAGYELRIVGGAVRDLISGKEPKDIDLASNATPEESMEILKGNDIRVIETGLSHGTITAHMDGEDYEITTLRIDTESDGRHARVEYTRDWELDAARRDLTFNAMSMDFNGTLFDYFGGRDDLDSGTANFVGNAEERVQEDYLRILRYFRFQARMDQPKFNPDTLKAIASNVSGLGRDRPKPISGERIWSEMSKILSGKNLESTLDKMRSTGVLDSIGLTGTLSPAEVKNNTDDPILVLTSMIGDVNALDTLRSRWKFSNSEYGLARFILRHRDSNLNLKDARYMYTVDGVDPELIIKLFEYQGRKDLISKFKSWEPPEFPLTGDDLIRNGINPGPDLGRIKQELKDRWAKSGFKLTSDELLREL